MAAHPVPVLGMSPTDDRHTPTAPRSPPSSSAARFLRDGRPG
jgi:hypothetical protein